MRRARPALRRALGHDAPDPRERLLRRRAGGGRRGRPAERMSAATRAPPGPLPSPSASRSIPRSAARRRAFGEARRRRASRRGPRRSTAATGPPRRRLLGRQRRRSVLRQGLARRDDHGDRLADRHVGAFGGAEPGQEPVGGRLDLDGHLVRLDLHQRLALRHLVSLGLEPAEHLAGLLGHSEGGHDHVCRQRLGPELPRRGHRPRPSRACLRDSCATRSRGSWAAAR